jgi:hypothetical protein
MMMNRWLLALVCLGGVVIASGTADSTPSERTLRLNTRESVQLNSERLRVLQSKYKNWSGSAAISLRAPE